MTIYDYIARAYVQARLPKPPSAYRPLADRLLDDGKITNPLLPEAALLRDLTDAGIIAHSASPQYLTTDADEMPSGTDHTYFIPRKLTLSMPYEAPRCPACDDAEALGRENKRLAAKVRDLEELLYSKSCSLAS